MSRTRGRLPVVGSCWQFDDKSHSCASIVPGEDATAMFGHEAVTDAEAESGSLAWWLGCVERLEDSGES